MGGEITGGVVQLARGIHRRRRVGAAMLLIAAVCAACGAPEPPVPRDVLNKELLSALAGSDVAALKRSLERGGDPNVVGTSGDTPLLIAATSGKPELVRALIAGGAKIDLRRHGAWDGETPLYAAATRGHAPVVQVLVEAGANVNVRRGATGTDVHVLFWPASAGDVATVALLLVNGATVDSRDLFAAVAGGHVEVVRRLFQAGADPRWSSREFRDVLEAAEHSPEPTRQKMVAVVNLFLPRGAVSQRRGR